MYNPSQECVKTSVLNALFEHKELTAKQAYKKIKTQHQVSYQYVHKVLKKLAEENIVLHQKFQYELNTEWIIAIKNKIDDFEKQNNYLKHQEQYNYPLVNN
jgi:predicted transcriptional regulator